MTRSKYCHGVAAAAAPLFYTPAMPARFPELGLYALPGQVLVCAVVVEEVAARIPRCNQLEELEEVLVPVARVADGVILHGSTPAELAPVLRAYAGRRPPGRFAERTVNPAR